MRTVLALALAASALPVSAAAPEPLVEVRRIPFEPAFEISAGGRHNVLFHRDAPVAYAVSDHHLFAFDARTGGDLGGLDLHPAAEEQRYGTWDLTNVGSRLLAWSTTADGLALIDVDDPSAPEFLLTGPGVWQRPEVVAAFDEEFFALRHGSGRLDLYSIASLRHLASVRPTLPLGSFNGPITQGGGGPTPFLALAERVASNPPRDLLDLYDVAGGVPTLRFSREETAAARAILADRSGAILIVLFDTYDPASRTWVETIDARTGATLASWDVPSGIRLVLCEGEGRQLAQLDPTGIEFVDLADPADPFPIGRLDLSAQTFPDERRVAPSATDPLVFVAGGTAREILVVDTRTAMEIARIPVEGGEPAGVTLQEPPDGTRRGTAIVRRYDRTGALSRGGLSHLDLFDLTVPSAPEATGRFLRNHPRWADGVRAIGGRHAAVYEIRTNSLALVDLSAGRVAQVTGAAARLGEFEIYDAPELRTAGRFALLAGPYGWERFELAQGGLEPLGSWLAAPEAREGLESAELTPGGTVIALGVRFEGGDFVDFLETVAIDGRTGRIPRVDSDLLELAVSPAGDLLAVSRPNFDGDTGVDVYDIADPSSPAPLWSLPWDVNEAVFDPTGTRLLVSGPLFSGAFTVAVFDARTGASLGSPSPSIPKYFYHGFGAQWIADGAWRAIYWMWDWLDWDNALVDLSGPEPTLIRTYYFDDAAPEFAPREGGGWYEVRRDPWENRSNMVVGNPDGEIAETGVAAGDQTGISAVRRGFVATVRPEPDSLATALWRDVSLNRRPVVVTPGDLEIECTFPEGASARLDASASWDPDSAPGTNDDLASFAWTVDGADAGADPAVDVVLALGSHEAGVDVSDVLGASSSGSFGVAVVDRVAPDVVVEFEPLFDGGVFTRSFRVFPAATDLCDTSPSVEARLRIPEAASAAPVDWEHAAAPSVEVRTGAKGTRVVVLGPDEDAARGAWEDARRGGGYALRSDSLLTLGAATRGVLWRFETEGLDLVRGVAYGDRDLVVDAEARDGSGNAAVVAASLRETVCATLPPGTGCPGP